MLASDFAQLMPDGCSAVLENMFFASVVDVVPEQSAPSLSDEAYTFGLRFSEDYCGSFGLQVDTKTAAFFAASFLGEDESDLTVESVKEVVGELANMLCGSVMSRANSKRKLVLSHPEPLESAPLAEAQDFYVVKLETDCGAVTTWISMEQTPVAA